MMPPILRTALLTGAIATVILSQTAQAITVSLGQTATLPGTTVAQRPELAGTSLAPNSYTLIGSSTPGEYQAQVLFDVIRESSGDLDFTFQVVGSPSTTPLNWQLSINNLLFPVLDTDVRLDTPGIDAPITVTVAPNGVATYSSTTALQPGEETHVFFIHAAGITQYKQGGSLFLTTDFGSEPNPPGLGSPNGTFGFGGYEVVPEPSELALLGLAVAALSLRMRRI